MTHVESYFMLGGYEITGEHEKEAAEELDRIEEFYLHQWWAPSENMKVAINDLERKWSVKIK